MMLTCILNEECSAHYFQKQLVDFVVKPIPLTENSTLCNLEFMTQPPKYVIENDDKDQLVISGTESLGGINESLIHDIDSINQNNRCTCWSGPHTNETLVFMLVYFITIGLMTFILLAGTKKTTNL